MRSNTRKLTLITPLGLLLTFFLIGCATGDNPVTAPQPAASDEVVAAPYPTLTEEQLDNLIPGFEIVRIDPRGYGRAGENLDDQNSRLIRKTQGGTVSHRNNGVQIGPWLLREDQTVTVSTPYPGRAVVDFYPHPYRFNGCIRMWIDLTHLQLPEGRRWDELAFFYQEEDGSLTRYWGQLDLNARTYTAWPDHFSRYIIGLPAN